MNLELKKWIYSEMLALECSTVCCRDMYVDCSQFASAADERPRSSSKAVRCSSLDASVFFSCCRRYTFYNQCPSNCMWELVKMQIYSNVQVRLWRPLFPSYRRTSPNWQLTAMRLVSSQKWNIELQPAARDIKCTVHVCSSTYISTL